MQKNLKAKLEKFSREQLLELLEELGNVPEVQKIIKAMVAPSKGDIDRLVQRLANRCEIFMCNSCNAKDYDRILSALTPIYGAYRFADTKTAAYITWKAYCVLLDNDIEDYYELIGDMISDLSFNIRQHPDMFTNEEKMRYAEFIED